MATALNLIEEILQELGVLGAGETPDADDAALCLSAINTVLDSWRLENLYAYTQNLVTFTLPAGTVSRTIGPGMQIDTVRPVRIESGSFITVGNLDYPLEVISQEQYDSITLKTLEGPWPTVCMYQDDYPTGSIKFYPLGACTVSLLLQVPLTSFPLSTTTFDMPPGYRRALSLTATEEVATKFKVQPQPITTMKARNARRILKRANFTVPELSVGASPQLPGRYRILGGV